MPHRSKEPLIKFAHEVANEKQEFSNCVVKKKTLTAVNLAEVNQNRKSKSLGGVKPWSVQRPNKENKEHHMNETL